MNPKKYFFLYLFLNVSSIFSSPKLILQDGIESYDISAYVSFLKDLENKLKIEDIIQKDKTENFFSIKGENQTFGLSKARIWGKLPLENKLSRNIEWLFIFEAPVIDEVNIYIVASGKIIKTFHHNSHHLFSERLIQHRKLIFPITAPMSPVTIYFNAKSDDVLELSTTLARPIAFVEKNYKETIFVGLYYGIMLSMIIYNTFLLFSTRDKSYFFYIISTFSYTLIQFSLDGLLNQYVLPDNYTFSRDLRVYLSSISIIFGLLFASSLLQIKHKYRTLHKMFLILTIICFIPTVFQFIYGFYIASIILVVCLFLYCTFQVSVGFILSFKIKLARYYFAAWGIYLIGIFIHAATYLEIYIPSWTFSMQLGSTIEALLLSLALGYRINLMRQSILEKDTELLNVKFTNLKDKMNPHFVLNTLSIIMSYLKRDVTKADAALNHFTSAYKYLVKHENQHLTSLENEIAFTKDYANILLIKFGDTLKIEYDIKGELENISIPFLSLQPIVENAFKHGIRKIESGKISITIKVLGNKVDIMVINSSNGEKPKNPFDGTLGAIRRRIHHFFEEGNLTISNIGNDTIVSIHYKNIIREDNLIISPLFTTV